MGLVPSIEQTKTLDSGIVRSDDAGKVNYLLVRDGPLYKRWAEHLTRNSHTRGGKRNWMKAHTADDLERFKESLVRHVEQFVDGEDSEDHAAAICFNLNGCLYVEERLRDADPPVARRR